MSLYKGTEFIAGTPDLSEYAKSSDVTSAINSLDSSVVKLSGDQTIAGTKTFSSAVKCANSATTGTAITTSAISKSANGYVKLGNGIIIQWGLAKITQNSTATITITLPTAFSNTNYSISAVPLTSAVDSSSRIMFQVTDKTNTSFKCTGNSFQTINCSWVAIGY